MKKPTKKQTRAALEESIAHWMRHEAGTAAKGEGIGPDDCALCGLFLSGMCLDCPVSKRTGQPGCKGTPYYGCGVTFVAGSYGDEHEIRDFRHCARDMRLFLESLRKDLE